jgi:hypothetical protein
MKKALFILLILFIIGHLILFHLISGSKLQGDVMGILFPCSAELKDGYLSQDVLDTSNLKFAYFFLLESTEEHTGLSCIQNELDSNDSSSIEGLLVKTIDSVIFIDNKAFPAGKFINRSISYWEFPQFWWKYKKDLTLENHGYVKGFLDKFSNSQDFNHPILYITGKIDVARTLNVSLVNMFKISMTICCILALYLIFIFTRSKFRRSQQ